MKKMIAGAALALMMAGAPALAQPAGEGPRAMRGLYAGMSEEGRAVMRTAMRADFDERRDERAKIKAARDKMLAIVEAETLDVRALKAAMDEERSIAAASHVRRQEAMLAGLEQLSVADRKAFVEGARASRERIAERLEQRRGGMREQRRGAE